MTVNYEIPYLEYTANGVTKTFPFRWSSGDPEDNYVQIDGVLAVEGVQYELENWEEHFGADIVFEEPPEAGTKILIYRDTPVTQQVDYEEGKPFPAEIHERQMDKDTRILQEIITAGKGYGGVVNLQADQQPDYVDILNDSGTDARILPWTTDGLKAGVALGEVIEFGGTPPSDGAPTTKPDGYIWWVLGEPAQGAGDPNIVMPVAALIIESIRAFPDIARAEFAYFPSEARIGYGYDQQLPLEEPEYTFQDAFELPVSSPGQYLIQMEKLAGPDPSGSVVDVWLDAASAADWYVSDDADFFGVFHIAPDLGGGVPDDTLKVSRRVTLRTTTQG